MSYDPTEIDINFDPLRQRMSGVAYHGNTPFDVPYISQISDNLWQGGCEDGLVLPRNIKHIVSLYPWQRYTINHEMDSELYFKMYDSLDQAFDQVERIADWINLCRETGDVLVHCQAGLNRSSLLASVALIRAGETDGPGAVELVRQQRSPACLCNSSFESFVREYKL